MKKKKCVIVDDEPLSRKVISDYVGQLDSLETVAEFKSALELRSFLESNETDVIFLDINMPMLSGLDFLKSQSIDALVIFITAYPDYAIDAFEYQAFDYLLKPVSFDRFLKTIDKIKLHFNNNGTEDKSKESMIIKQDKRLYKVDINSIKFIQAYGDYVKIHSEKKTYITKDKLSSYKKTLRNDFVQCHRSFIINVQKVQYLEGNQAVIGEDKIPISAGYRDEFLSHFS